MEAKREGEERPPIRHYETLAYATITKRGGWWNVLCLLKEPKKGNIFLALNRYVKKGGVWKRQTSFKINRPHHCPPLVSSISELHGYWMELEKPEATNGE